MMKRLLFLLFYGLMCTLPGSVYSQTQFDMEQLENPVKYGPAVTSVFKQNLIYEYKTTPGKHVLFLKNGLRTARFVNPENWKTIRDTVFPYRIDIVYSRYPVRYGTYQEIYPLLFDRLRHLFELDPLLNDDAFEWNTVLQTHCDDDDQVNTLFHGIVIWYRTPQEENALNRESDSVEEITLGPRMEIKIQGSFKEFENDIEAVKKSEAVGDSLRVVLKNKPLDEQNTILKKHFEIAIRKNSSIKLLERSPQEINLYKRQVQLFLKNNPFSDSVVWKVFNRHPEWTDIAVVNDWTGSMYGYGAQVLHWHLMNYQTSPIRFLSLFNDGDRKMSNQKKIGETGGIYSVESADIPQIINLFNLVRINGSGGDRQENDIEAILETQKRYPEHKEIVLIADNLACIRDIELASKIGKPVKIILCGYMEGFGINPHLVYLAKITNGGLYTLERDFENLKVEIGANGEIKSIKDKRFGLNMLNCTNVDLFIKAKKENIPVYFDLDSASKEPFKIRKLDLRGKDLKIMPSEILKMEHLFHLNMSDNQLVQIPGNIKRLKSLTELNISGNQIKKLPNRFLDIKYLEYLNVSNNQLQNINPFFISFFYLRVLDISNNQISEITDIHLLKNALSLNLSYNQIKEIPVTINQLKRLKVLDLSNNRIEILPKTFIGLTKLEELNMENNELDALPKYLYRLRKLKSMNLAGNNLSEEEKDRIRKELPLVQVIF